VIILLFSQRYNNNNDIILYLFTYWTRASKITRACRIAYYCYIIIIIVIVKSSAETEVGPIFPPVVRVRSRYHGRPVSARNRGRQVDRSRSTVREYLYNRPPSVGVHPKIHKNRRVWNLNVSDTLQDKPATRKACNENVSV